MKRFSTTMECNLAAAIWICALNFNSFLPSTTMKSEVRKSIVFWYKWRFTNHDGEMFEVLYEEKHGFGSRWKYWFNCAIGGVTMHFLVQIYVFALGCKIIQELRL